MKKVLTAVVAAFVVLTACSQVLESMLPSSSGENAATSQGEGSKGQQASAYEAAKALEGLKWYSDPGPNQDAGSRAEALPPMELQESVTFEEALADSTFGSYVPAYIPSNLVNTGFKGAQRNYSYQGDNNGWLLDELTISLRLGSAVFYIYLSRSANWDKSDFAGEVVEPEDLTLSLIEAKTAHYDYMPDVISVGIHSDDVIVRIHAEGLSAVDVLAALHSVKGVYEQPDPAVAAKLNQAFHRYNFSVLDFWPSNIECLVEHTDAAVICTLTADAVKKSGGCRMTAETGAVIASRPDFQIPRAVELVLPGSDAVALDTLKTGLRVICLLKKNDMAKDSYDTSITTMFYITDDELTVPVYTYPVFDALTGYTVDSLARLCGSVLN